MPDGDNDSWSKTGSDNSVPGIRFKQLKRNTTYSFQWREIFSNRPPLMRCLVTFLFLLLALSTARAQEFDRLGRGNLLSALSQLLHWGSASSTASPGLPHAFLADSPAWAFAPYVAATVLPTATSQDVWLRFTLAATAKPQS